MDDKNYFLCKAKVYEQTERWDDMAESMVKVAEFKHGLTTEERDLFSVAFKNSIGPKRSALKIISGIGDKTDTPEKLDIIQELKDKVKHSLIKPNIHHFYNILATTGGAIKYVVSLGLESRTL
uniref:14-3-3 domain-containing protein n=1 Tax=Cynoglossus semilaevis TaxID=244447 RepID=A0A3P8WE16_CYNSE